ncbi:FAD binding domain-containing protein [Dactylosporangium sp. CA-233914]|uniref:FAD binding domain-containing protein n=1 Tax=Dactylosporangium sp. CA-233914 TaxID=3239934 RepID=UPI003D8D9C5B
MREFGFAVAGTVADALAAAEGTAFLAGGTTLVDLMKLGVMRPPMVLDINGLPLREITVAEDGVMIGALARMSDVALHPEVRHEHPLICEALLAGASQQLRNMASVGGNLLQRSRCGYFRDVASPCNRREPGTGCAAIGGSNRMHAIIGTSAACVATHPSDLAVALVASEATVTLAGRGGTRTVPVGEFYLTPGDSPHQENILLPGELVTQVHIPRGPAEARAAYVKVRDRASYEFALASAAVRLAVEEGVIAEARVAVGGVATVPWRLHDVEAALVGLPAVSGQIGAAAALASAGARPLTHNAFKVPLLERTVERAIEKVISAYANR